MVLLASDYDKSKYLRAEDLKQERKFRIKAVTEEVFENNGKTEKKLVCWFTNDERGLVLNKTNNRTIRGAFGDPVADWIGKIVIVFPMMTDVRGKMTPALRVRIPPPKSAAVAPQQPAAPQQPTASGNGAAAAPPAVPQQSAVSGTGAAAAAAVPAAALATAAVLAAADPELEPDPVKLLRDEMDDEVGF